MAAISWRPEPGFGPKRWGLGRRGRPRADRSDQTPTAELHAMPDRLPKPKPCSDAYCAQHSRLLLLRFGLGRQPATDRLQQLGCVDRLGNVVRRARCETALALAVRHLGC